jgi:hypothetical protein
MRISNRKGYEDYGTCMYRSQVKPQEQYLLITSASRKVPAPPPNELAALPAPQFQAEN